MYEFRGVKGDALPPFRAGAHIDLYLPNGMMRQYSLVNAESELDRYVVAVKRDPKSRGGSIYVTEQLKIGTILTIGAPRNNFRLHESSPHTILIAGGIGITPLWSMVQRLESIRASWELHYAARRRREMAFIQELACRAQKVRLHVDEECGGAVMAIGAIVDAAPPAAHIYCCGPSPMLAEFRRVTAALPPEIVHLEHFSSDYSTPTGCLSSFNVELARSGRVIPVPAGATILAALRANGVDVASSCEQGVCGACETRVIRGVPDHRDMILSAQERIDGKTMMICCSGSNSSVLVLDL